jgi:N-methylhydantoinase B
MTLWVCGEVLAGGESAAPSALYLIRYGQKQALRSKVTNMMVKSGAIIWLETSGGGFGEARLRARELVECDVRLGYVSAAVARDSYAG